MLQVSAVMDMSDQTYSYTQSATPTINSLSVNATTFTISGTNFGTDASKVTVTLVSSASVARKKRSLEEEEEVSVEETDEFYEDEDWLEHLETAEREMALRWEENELREEMYGPHIFHNSQKRRIPKLQPHYNHNHNHMSDDIGTFWSKLTGTPANSYHESRKLGVWRVGGSALRKNVEEEKEDKIIREKRQAESDTFSCVVTSSSDSEIQCNAPQVSAGSYIAIVNVEGIGNANVTGSAQVTATPVIDNINPNEGSTNGGSIITITGSAFDTSDVTVVIGDVSCNVLNTTTTTITCQTMSHIAATLTVKVISAGEESNDTNSLYTYAVDKTPILTTLRYVCVCV